MSIIGNTSKEALLGIVNAGNSTTFTVETLTVNPPSVVDAVGGLPGTNTAVPLDAKPDSGYSGTVTVRYHRLGMDEVFGPTTIVFTPSAPSADPAVYGSEFVAFLQSAWGIPTAADEYETVGLTPYPEDPNSLGILELSFKNHYVLHGDAIAINIKSPVTGVDIATLITTTEYTSFTVADFVG